MSKKQAELQERWQQRIREQEKSGRSIRAYCRERGIGEHSFYQWRLRLRPETPVGFALVETNQPAEQMAMMELALPGGEVLRIPPDAASLRLVLAAVRQQA